MKDEKETNAGKANSNRQWVAPQLTVLNAKSTEVGGVVNTVEAYSYRPS